MPNKMTITEFATNCITYGFEFELKYFERDHFDEYCLCIILSNHECIVPTWDEHKLANLWYKKILEYYIH